MSFSTHQYSSCTPGSLYSKVGLRPEFLDARSSAFRPLDLPLQTTRYVDELRSFNVNDYLPCPKNKLDLKLNYSYSEDFNNYFGRDPESIRWEPSSTPRLYQPTVSLLNLNKSYQENGPLSVRRTFSTIENRDEDGQKKQKTALVKKGKTPDLNNNFFKDARGKFGLAPEKWADCQVYNRIEELAKPKQLPCEYRDNRRSVYWMTKRPPPKEEGCNHTHFETSCRLDELAEPKVICGEFCGTRHCCWESEYPQPPVSCIDPRSVDWSRLACPKRKYPPNGAEIQTVKRTALKALPTKRLCKLSEPKPVIDTDKYYLWLWKKKPDNEVILKKIRRLSLDKCDLVDMRVIIRLLLSCTATEESCRKLKATIPTIQFALDKGAQSVVMICCYGDTNGKIDPEFSLQPLREIFENHLNHPVIYLEDCVGYQARSLCADPEPGSVFLLENLSFHPEEKGKFIDPEGREVLCKQEEISKFCSVLFDMGDVYVVDSITELVEMSNSTVGTKEQDKAYGFIIKSELQHYNQFVVSPEQPMVAIIGGSFKDKIKIVRNLMGKAQEMILGGELAMIFLKVIKKIEIGNIPVTPKMLKQALKIYSRAKDTKTIIYLPSDVVVCHCKTGQYFSVLTREDIDEDYQIVDIGPFTRNCYQNVLTGAKTMVWCGLMGDLPDGTAVISKAFALATRHGVSTYITDEQTRDAFDSCGQKDVTHITLNGEVTTLLLNGKLPKGLAVLNKYRHKMKKHPPKPVTPSTKPTVYELPGMMIDSGARIKCINDVALEDKRVVIRVDFDVPNSKSTTISNDYRIRMTIPTIKYALRHRAKSVVIMAHCGQPGGKKISELSLKLICEALATLLGQTVLFIPETVGKSVESVLNQIHPGNIIMVENLRFNPGETGESCSNSLSRDGQPIAATPQALAQFCEGLTNLGDVYVDDAFACLHLDHSSMTGYLGNIKVCGFLVKNELKYMTKVFNNVKRKFLVILGGLCTREKLVLLLDLLKEADNIIIAGTLATLFLKIDLGMDIGRNSFDYNLETLARQIIELAPYYKCKLHYPVDLWIAQTEDGSNPQLHSITKPIPDGMSVVDVGDLSASMFSRIVRKSNIILWCGTVGVTEPVPFVKGSKKLLDTITEVTRDPEKRVISIVCGRSCSEFIQTHNPNHEGITHLSTGGAAVIKLLNDRKLMALEVLNCKPPGRLTNILAADSGEFTDQRVLVKADLNLDVEESGQVRDPFPLRQLIPLIKFLQRKGARSITLIGYRGEACGVPDEKYSLAPLKEALETVLDQPVVFIPEGVSDAADIAIRSQEPGRVLLLENIRFHPEEIGVKELPGGLKIKVSYDALNDYRNKLSSLGDALINESFLSLYDADSSTVGLKHKTKLAGLNLKKEVIRYFELRDTLEHPVLAIIGGKDSVANVSRIQKMLHFVDELILCGGVASAYFASQETVKIGKTAVNEACLKYFHKLIKKAKVCGIPIHLPVDLVVAESLLPPPPPEVTEEEVTEAPVSDLPKTEVVTTSQGVPQTSMVCDIGPDTIQEFQQLISNAKTIIYIGDAGAYDYEPFSQGTKALMSSIQTVTNNGSTSVALGMDTGVCLGQLNALDTFTYYSTGVETFTEIMLGRSLPGLAVLSTALDKKLKKLRIDQMDLRGKRVLIRLDLDVPTCEGVVLDTDKLEEALPTIRYALKMGAKSVVLVGHRGEPNGFKNYYLKMEPLLEELNQLLELKVTYVDRPCSMKAMTLLSDPEPGSVFLMENLKFYPAEYGRDPEPKEKPKDETEENPTQDPAVEEIQSREATQETDEEPDDDAILSVSDGDGGRNIDAVMFQKMALKTVDEYRNEIAACGDVFINDDVKDVEQTLTSLEGFGLEERAVGFLLIKFLLDADDNAYNLPGVLNLSPAPPS